jgi:hypothetical protein
MPLYFKIDNMTFCEKKAMGLSIPMAFEFFYLSHGKKLTGGLGS